MSWRSAADRAAWTEGGREMLETGMTGSSCSEVQRAVTELAAYGLKTGLIAREDVIFTVNMLLKEMGMDSYEESEAEVIRAAEEISDEEIEKGSLLESILKKLTDEAVRDSTPLGSDPQVPGPGAGKGTGGSDRLVLQFFAQYGLYPSLQGAPRHEVENTDGIRRPGYHHQSLQTGEGSQGYRSCRENKVSFLPEVPALPGE